MAIKELRSVPIVKTRQTRAWPTSQERIRPRISRAFMGSVAFCSVGVSRTEVPRCCLISHLCCKGSRDPMSDVRAWQVPQVRASHASLFWCTQG